MRRAWCLIAAAALAAGCGSGAVLPVSGIVTMDGAPMDGATVMFYPEEKAGGMAGTATTGTDGKFVIVGLKGQRGLVPGKYKVTVTKMKIVPEGEVVGAITDADVRDDLPPHYSDPSQTKLSYRVTGDGQPIEIKLTKKKK